MHEIFKNVSLSVDGKLMDFRLTKLDAFSGASLLRLLSSGAEETDLRSLFSALPDKDLHALMRTCLEHTEVLLPAGWCPVMTRGEWSYPELSHDPLSCLKLTLEEVLWTLDGFFGEGGSAFRAAGANS